jgi:hypothetical protein
MSDSGDTILRLTDSPSADGSEEGLGWELDWALESVWRLARDPQGLVLRLVWAEESGPEREGHRLRPNPR